MSDQANGPALGPVRSFSADRRRRENGNKDTARRKHPTKLVKAAACCLLSPLTTTMGWILRGDFVLCVPLHIQPKKLDIDGGHRNYYTLVGGHVQDTALHFISLLKSLLAWICIDVWWSIWAFALNE